MAIDPQFLQDQEEDPRLDDLHQDVAVSDGTMLDFRRVPQVPHIE